MFNKLENLDKKTSEISTAKKAEIERLCAESHIISIGDELVVNHNYSHEGKTIAVDTLHIIPDGYPKKYCFAASGLVKKKNGELGVHRGWWINTQ